MSDSPKYIFCISTGRSGTNYLDRILDTAEDSVSTHEPEQRCNGKVMRKFLLGNEKPMDKLMPGKAASIERVRGDHKVYIETSHCFIKGFGWLLPELLGQENISVIILRRDKQSIVSSYMQRNAGCLTKSGRKYLMTPDKLNPCAPPPSINIFGPKYTYRLMYALSYPFRTKRFWRFLGLKQPKMPKALEKFQQQCLEWYVDETYAMSTLYKKQFPNIQYADVNLNDLNTFENVNKLFTNIGLSTTDSTKNIINKKVNENPKVHDKPLKSDRQKQKLKKDRPPQSAY